MKIKIGSNYEEIITKKDFSLNKARDILSKERIAVIGYGVQGPGQALNLKDNGLNVIIGQRKPSKSWNKALKDGWIANETLFEIEEAAEKGSIIMLLLSDAAQMEVWPKIKPFLSPGKGLYFSHGFGLTFNKQTQIFPPKEIDIFLVAPKGSGTSLRRLFKEGKGLNSSYAIYQNYTGNAEERALAIGIGIGSAFLFKTTFQKEVYSDLTGERGTLMGAIQGIFSAQYQVLRENGHSPSEAFNETVEELTQSLMPLIAEKGMDWMYENCSTTAQRGALDWWKQFRDINISLFRALYQDVASGKEAERTLSLNSKSNYRDMLNKELKEIKKSELWKAGEEIRKLRPS
ncbi:ketol-acid reductoisomerase [Candidatus Karelsulcia muelleri]